MNKKLIGKILGKMQHDLGEYSVRDITFLTCTIFNETHVVSFNKFFGFDKFSLFFWFVRNDGHAVAYRSGKEYLSFAEYLGKKFFKDIKLAKKTANTLIRMSDEINEFIKKNKKPEKFLKKKDYLVDLYRDFFAYHQAVYWPSEYLLKNKNEKNGKKIDKIIKILDKAYKYNETVVPNVENYFIKLGIADLSFEELGKIKRAPKKRSAILLDNKSEILSYSEAIKIDKAIRRDYEKFIKEVKIIKGLPASPGNAIGRVRLVKDLAKLKNCKKGDVLVTTQTRPQYNAFIKNVSAIVTDEGGLLCHASMLAREFNIPCVVGTRVATVKLKDGDLVEVDAERGIIKILKK